MPRVIKILCAAVLMLTIFCSTAFAEAPFTSDRFLLQRTIFAQNESGNTKLTIYKNHPEDQVPFYADNMFPGDNVQKTYLLAVSYRGTVTVHFRADIRPGYEKLAEVMNCKVVLKNTGETLYDGLMKDMPESLEHKLVSKNAKTDELEYDITVYLSTSVGNKYMNQELIADFTWCAVEETVPDDGGDDGSDAEEDDDDEPVRPTQKPDHDIITDQPTGESADESFLPGELVKPPKTGDISLIPIVAAAGCAALLLILLLGKRRKEEAEHER